MLAAVDAAAAERGLTRTALMGRLLAEGLARLTPELVLTRPPEPRAHRDGDTLTYRRHGQMVTARYHAGRWVHPPTDPPTTEAP